MGSGVHSESRALIYGFQASAVNRTGKSIERINGYVQSLITGEKFEMFLVVNGIPIRTEKTHGIPPNAGFVISAPFHHEDHPPKNGDRAYMTLNKFESELRAFEFVCTYDGVTFRKTFGTEETRPTIEGLRNLLIGTTAPRVKRKDD